MKLKTYFNATLLCLATSLFAACAGDNLADSDNNKGKQPIEEVKGVHFSVDSPKASAKLRVTLNEDGTTGTAKTRTVIKHTIGNGADAYWSDNDKLWVKDKNGNWKQSIATYVYDEGRRATFIMPGSANDYNDNCQVAYCSADLTDFSVSMFAPDGIGNGYPVTHISYEQNQTTPNDFSKAGEWGDCGVGTAKKKTNKFDFTLDHSTAYLCLLPRCENATLGQNIELTNIQIKADNPMQLADIASNIFELHDDGTIHYPNDNPGGYGNPSSMITATVANFPLTHTTTSLETNACYFVLRPALHDFTITYTIKDKVTGIEAEIKKQVNGVDCKAGEITDITSNLTLPSQAYTNIQPTSGVPNAEEAAWYAELGDAHVVTIPASVVELNGHLENIAVKGIWLKKRAAIIRDNPALFVTDAAHNNFSSAYHGVMFSEWSWLPLPDPLVPGWDGIYSIKEGVPANLSDYFFLPALGGRNGLSVVGGYGTIGAYWTSSKHYNPDDYGSYTVPTPYSLYFNCTTKKIYLKDDVAFDAMVKQAFE